MNSSARLRLAILVGALTAPTILSAQGRPETHTVKPGDTLWDLAQAYLGDPFLWPEIYRLNTNVVEDPHWIYPGEVLRLGGGAEVSAVPSEDTPPPAGREAAPPGVEAAAPDPGAEVPVPEPRDDGLAEPQVGDLDEGNAAANRDDVDMTPLVGDRNRARQLGPSLELNLARHYRPLRRSEFYSSGFLSEQQELPFGRILGSVTPLQIEEVSNQTSAHVNGRIAVLPPLGGKYQVGDTLLTVVVQREIENHGNVILPTGLLRVVDVSRPEHLAEVIASYGQIHEHQRVLPAEKFVDPGNLRAVRISDGVRGTVLAHRDKQPLTGPQDVIFLDKGRKDGVAIGDIFEVRQTPRARTGGATVVNEVMGTVQVVHVGDRTATARVISLTLPDIRAGSEARQIAKLPS